MKRIQLLIYLLFSGFWLSAQNLTGYEYWFNNDHNSKQSITITPSEKYLLNTNIDASSLSEGVNILNIRFKDVNGAYSSTLSEIFYKSPQNEVTNNLITAFRYWIDSDFSNSTDSLLTTGVSQLNLTEELNLSSVPMGKHAIHFQFKDLAGNWSVVSTDSITKTAIPEAVFSVPSTLCANSPVDFTNKSVDADTWFWDFGDGDSSKVFEPVHSYSMSGDYEVTLTATDSESGKSDTLSQIISLNPSYGVSIVAPENLIAFYPLNGNADDESGFGRNGTVYEALPTTDRNGNSGQAYYFDGVNDYIDMGDWENGGPMSFTFWARWDAFNNYSRIVDLGNGSSNNNIIVANYQAGDNIFFSVYNNSSEIKYYTSALTLGQWDYFAATIDDQGEMKVYKNGALIGNKTNTYVPNILTRTAQYIGKSNFSADGYFKGAIDELKVYNKALSAEEVLLDYEGNGGISLPPVEAEICASETPYTFGIQQISSSGTYYETFQTINGCDSMVQLNLTVHPVYSSLEMPDPTNLFAYYPFNGNSNDESGNGNDGTVIGASLTADRNGNSNSAYLFDGNYGIDVPHSDDLNMEGALSVSCWIKPTVLQNAMIFGKSNYSSTTNYLLRVQSDGNIQWEYDGYLYTTTSPLQANNWYHIVVTANNPGEHRKIYVNGQLLAETASSSGPTGVVTNKLTIGYSSSNGERFRGVIDDIRFYEKELNETEITALFQESTLIKDVEICASETPYIFGNQQLTASGTYTETFHSEYSCDSTVTLNLIVNSSYELSDSATVCENELPYYWGDSTLTSAGTYTQVLTTVDGCDSLLHFNLIVNDTSLVFQEMPICENDLPLIIGTDTFYTEGTHTIEYNNISGCDSTVILTLNIKDTSLVTEELEICKNLLPVTFGTQILSSSGVYTEVFIKNNGCDSTVVLTLNVLDTVIISDTVSVCESELPYVWEGDDLSTTGTYTKVYTAINGCDSTVTLTLSVLDTSLIEKTVTICESELPYAFGSQSLDTSGVFTEIYDKANGCDSTIVLTFNVLDTSLISKELTICESDLPYYFGTQTLTSNGIYTEIFTGSNTCDSTVVLTFTVKDSFVVSDAVSVCEKDLPFLWEGDNFWSAGPYTKVLTADNGCDSTVTLTLSVLDTSLIEKTVTICESELPYTFGSQSLDTSGVFTEVYKKANGCDSTIILTFNVLDTCLISKEVAICESDLPYIFGTQTLTSSGIYTEIYTGNNSCDSTVVLYLTVNDTFRIDDTLNLCENDLPYIFGSQTLTADGTYTELFTSSAGCDSTVILVFAISDTSHSSFADTICENDLPYIFGSQSLSSSGTYTETFAKTNGCDSVVTLELTVHNSYNTHIYQTVSPSELPYVFASNNLTTTGTYTNSLSTVFGCDSIITLHLTVKDEIPPVAKCHPIEVELSAEGSYTLSDADLDAIAQGSSDDVTAFDDLTITVTPSTFSCSNLGETSVTVEVKDAAGNKATCQTTVLVVDGIKNPEIDGVADQIIGEDSTLLLTLTGISGGTACEEWEVALSVEHGNPELTGSLNILYEAYSSTAVLEVVPVAQQHGTDSITITVQDTLGNMTTTSFLLTVNEVNDPPTILEMIEDLSMYAGDSSTITISKISGNYFDDVDDNSLVFDFTFGGSGLPEWLDILEDDEKFSLTFTPTPADTGCFEVVVSIQDLAGMIVDDTFLVCINPLEVGISQLDKNTFGINLYPNPTSGSVNIDLDNPPTGEIELLVTNISGGEVFRKNYQSGEKIVFSLSEHISGSYLVILRINQQRIVKKLILEKN